MYTYTVQHTTHSNICVYIWCGRFCFTWLMACGVIHIAFVCPSRTPTMKALNMLFWPTLLWSVLIATVPNALKNFRPASQYVLHKFKTASDLIRGYLHPANASHCPGYLPPAAHSSIGQVPCNKVVQVIVCVGEFGQHCKRLLCVDSTSFWDGKLND